MKQRHFERIVREISAHQKVLFFALLSFGVGLMIFSKARLIEAQPATASINLTPSVRYQTMGGWEATAQAGELYSPSWNIYKNSLLDSAVGDLGLNRMRLEIVSGVENPTDYFSQWRSGQITESQYNSRRFEIINDNSSSDSINPSGFKWSSLDSTINALILPMRARLQARGESLWVNVNYVDFGPSSFEHKNNPQEYAEFVLATYQHMQGTYGFVPDSWEVVLEPDTSSASWSASQVAQAIKAAGDRLIANGYTPNFVAPATVNASNAPLFIDQIAQTAGAMSYVSEFSYHRYCCASETVLQNISNRAVQFNKRSAMLEWIGADYTTLHEDIKLGRNSSWQQYCLAGPISWGPDNGDRYYIVDDSNVANPALIMGSRTKFIRQYFKYVRAGAVRIEALSNHSNFDPVAFINTDGKYVVVVKTLTGGAINLSGLAPATYGVKYTTANQYDINLPNITVSAGQPLTTTIPDAGVITIYSVVGGPSPTPSPTPAPTSTPAPTATPTTSPTAVPTATPPQSPTPFPTASPTSTPGACIPTLTMTEVFPGSLAAFTSVSAGQNSIIVDVADTGIGLQGLTLISALNADITIPSFPSGTLEPVTMTFAIRDASLPADFTLRASARSSAILITARCAVVLATPTPTPQGTPTPVVTPTPSSGTCTPLLTVTEIFPGSLATFDAIVPGPGSVTVDAVDAGIGLQAYTLVSSGNADVTIPLFPLSTTGPVTATFTVPNAGSPVDFSLRASQRRTAVLIRAQCGN